MPLFSRSGPRLIRQAPWALLFLVGCGSGSTDGISRYGVSGSVTFNGKPLETGSISFDPDGGSANPTSGGSLIQSGSYSIEQATGLTSGTYRVAIRSGGDSAAPKDEAPGPPARKPSKEPIPAQYNSKSTLKVEVKDSGSPRFDFDLKS